MQQTQISSLWTVPLRKEATEARSTNLSQIKEKYPDVILMADISTYEEGVNAWKCGVDFVGTTLSGYTDYSPKVDGPDTELVKRPLRNPGYPGHCRGKVHYPDQAVEMFEAGAYAVVVGGAITRPWKSQPVYQSCKRNITMNNTYLGIDIGGTAAKMEL